MSVAQINTSAVRVTGLDLDAYFRRIDYAGGRQPTLEVLQAIVSHHVQTIPFENINPWLGWPVYLDLASLQHKLIHKRRGGYCFEQNWLLSHVLQALGFEVMHLAARVLWNRSPNAQTPRSHMLLRITIEDQPYIVDVGFGGMTLTGVLRLETDVAQSTPHEPFRLVRAGNDFLMQAEVRGNWATLYSFDLQEQLLADYEVSNWYLSHHPQSHFITGLILARPAIDGRYALRNTELAIHHRSGPSQRHVLTSVAELRATLEESFLLTLPDEPALGLALQRLVEQAG